VQDPAAETRGVLDDPPLLAQQVHASPEQHARWLAVLAQVAGQAAHSSTK
jgi:hypothetical protein